MDQQFEHAHLVINRLTMVELIQMLIIYIKKIELKQKYLLDI
jgi:hypothetical protein